MQKVIIDCDPGHDDAIAIFMAAAAREAIDIVGMTTVAGNIDLPQATRNAIRVCEIAGLSALPVHAGCSRPMVNRFFDASDYHGPTGLDGLGSDLGEPVISAGQHAVDYIIDAVLGADEPITLLCLAPLTNLAVALIKAPQIAQHIGEVIFMGGARRAGGNVTPSATFNLFCDPHAGHVVVESGVNLTMVSLDATSQVVVGDRDVDRLASAGGAVGTAAANILSYFNRRRMERYGLRPEQCLLNDACAVAYLLDRSLFSGRRAHVAIEVASGLTAGMSVVDLTGVTGKTPNALWIDGAEPAGVTELLHRTIAAHGS